MGRAQGGRPARRLRSLLSARRVPAGKGYETASHGSPAIPVLRPEGGRPIIRLFRVRRWLSGVVVVVACLTGAHGEGLPASWSGIASDPGACEALVRAIASERVRGGYSDMSPLAAALLKTARSELELGSVTVLAKLAAEAAPADPRTRAFQAGQAGQRFAPAAAVRELGAWLGSLFSDPWIQSLWVLRVGTTLCAGAWAGALALMAAAGVLFGHSLMHDYSDSFPTRFRRYTPLAFGIVVLTLLAASGVGPAVFLCLIGMVLSPYLPRRAQIAVGLCLALGCLLPASLSWFSGVGGEQGTRAWALYRVWRGDSGSDLAEELSAAFAPTDSQALYARARVARRDGNYDLAQRLLIQGLNTGGDERLFQLELGNLSFLRGAASDALSRYKRASLARPDDPLPWLNRHIAQLALLELAEADAALEKARSLDSKAVERHQNRVPGEADRLMPVSDPLPKEWVRAELLGRDGVSPEWVRALEEGLFTPVRALRPIYVGIFALATALLAGRWGRGRRSHRCPSCGFVVCPRCSRRIKNAPLCPGCWAAGREKNADSTERERQASNARKWQGRTQRWKRVGWVLLPGWCDFLLNRPVQGLLQGLAWALAFGWIASAILYPAPLLPWAGAGMPWAGAVALALLHLAAIWRSVQGPKPNRG